MIDSIIHQSAPDNVDAVKDHVMAMIPMRRFGTNEEVAEMMCFMAGPFSAYSTGGVFTIDGGLTSL